MIASLSGKVISHDEDSLVVDIGGIGLRVYTTRDTCGQARAGELVFLHTHLVVREDALTLFGFETEKERDFFLLLLGVNGIGPRIALSALSTLSVDAIRRAVLSEQPEIFSRVPGIGKKGAQRVFLHLQGRVGEGQPFETSSAPDSDSLVLEALTGLGYSVVEAQTAIQSLPEDAPKDVETRLMLALQFFS
jgi:Holliday junction DNA helicase RuvA